jgi:hypothetical protein
MARRELRVGRSVAMFEKVAFGHCSRCDHQIALAPPVSVHGWAHHITRSRRDGIPHWPAGHVLTTRCLHENCGCVSPSPNLDFPVITRLVYLGKISDPLKE